jgi:predicted DNA-binding transcriptional regulator YafY
MYHPATRLLTILELLQTHGLLSGEALSGKLEVEPRSVRRYIAMLQDMGFPVDAVRGPGGGYRLRPGFKLPPLLFTEEEALALVIGLLSTSWLGIEAPSPAVEGALAKVLRVLPLPARERLRAFSANLVLSPNEHASRPAAVLLIDLSEAVELRRRIWIEYHSYEDELSQRTVEPYGMVGWWGYWYLVAYCCLRHDFRTFRLDRLQQMKLLGETFSPREAFDLQAYASEQLGHSQAALPIVVKFQAPLHTVQEKIPPEFGTLTETARGVLFESRYGNMADVARFLVSRNLPFLVKEPPELKGELLRLAQVLTRSVAG